MKKKRLKVWKELEEKEEEGEKRRGKKRQRR